MSTTNDFAAARIAGERLGLPQVTYASELTVDGPSVRFRVDDGASVLPGLLRELDAAGITMTSVEVRRPSLDDVFLTLTGRSLREDAPTAEPAEVAS